MSNAMFETMPNIGCLCLTDRRHASIANLTEDRVCLASSRQQLASACAYMETMTLGDCTVPLRCYCFMLQSADAAQDLSFNPLVNEMIVAASLCMAGA